MTPPTASAGRGRCANPGVRRVQFADHQPQDGAHLVGIARALDQRRVRLAHRIPIDAVIVRIGVVIALRGPGFLEDRHFLLVEIDIHFGIDVHRASLPVVHADGRHVAAFQEINVARIGAKIARGCVAPPWWSAGAPDRLRPRDRLHRRRPGRRALRLRPRANRGKGWPGRRPCPSTSRYLPSGLITGLLTVSPAVFRTVSRSRM